MNPLETLLERGEVTDTFSREVEQLMTEGKISLEAALLKKGIAREVVRKLFAEYHNVPFFELQEGFNINEEILAYVPEESAIHYRLIPLYVEDEILMVGVNDPEDLQLREVLNFVSAKHNIAYKVLFMLEDDILKAHAYYANLKGEVTDALVSLESELNAEIAAGVEEASPDAKKTMEHIEEDAPVTKIVATILRYAVDGGASDIHIEPTDAKVTVRFRVDGDLNMSLELPKNVHLAVVARVKILSSMRLDERRKPQDGRFSATFDGRKIDFRVSLLPTSHGEKVVMRILDNERGVRSLEDVGVSGHLLEVIRRVIKEPYGIILISGPTGSGKSTTLYAMLSEVDRFKKNVLSLEDPIEYNINGVSQSQVRPEIGYTFANGLRAALRQDPDIIMVGEIRDKETAQLAIQAALTGHLVLSTIHTNNAIGVVPRLIDMGVDPYLIAPTLKLAIAQRLARRLCDKSGKEEVVTKSTQMMMDQSFNTLPQRYHNRIPKSRTMLRPEPVPGCATGLRGRVAVMEALEVNEEIQELILRNSSEEQMFQTARKNGFMTMKEDAIIKALDHVIPYEEMNTFGTKVGLESFPEEIGAPVDNPVAETNIPAIINLNEDITS
ncbi:MAG TPA: ATPase, T2SS/T4P/T4SS family [Candidatus Paceibacterota bacterium]|nr:ATPase, T2SS/T4P/T4SS family [Candidatus Paceibacterota bacterium]